MEGINHLVSGLSEEEVQQTLSNCIISPANQSCTGLQRCMWSFGGSLSVTPSPLHRAHLAAASSCRPLEQWEG